LEIAIILLVVGLYIAFQTSRGKSAKRKYITWGITIMLIISPIISMFVSIIYGLNAKDGFAGVALMMILLPLTFLIGLIILILGIFKKNPLKEGITKGFN